MFDTNNKTEQNMERGHDKLQNPYDLILGLIKKLKENERDVLIRRFGLSGKKNETLEEVGKRRGVTRERIRQIEKNSIKKLQKIYTLKQELQELEKNVTGILNRYGGLMEENHLLDTALEPVEEKIKNKQALLFALNNLFAEPNLLKKHNDFYNSWYLSAASLETINSILNQVTEKVDQNKQLISEEDLKQIFTELEVSEEPSNAYMTATRKIEKNNFGQWGLASWNTVTPKRVGDKAYLVLKESGKPLHFTDITEEINKAAFDDEKEANVGTVHNELILDKRYVLIGRGMYALEEWGYYPGTTSEVISQLLKQNGKMHREEIVKQVSKQRLVRPNTIKVALMDKSTFRKIERNVYGLV